ncbi:MAG: EI24 domain-containing protein [Bacteroidota bacterium]|jgi:CysZ protein
MMGIIPQLGLGFKNHAKAFEFIFKHNLWYYFFLPAILTIVLFVLGYWGIQSISQSLTEYLITQLFPESIESSILQTIIDILAFFVSVLIKFLLGIILYNYLKYIVLIFCSPILAHLSEKTEALVTGISTPFSFRQFLKDISRGILVVFRNFIIETGVFIASLLFVWIPIFKWFVLPIQWGFNWYFIGYSLFDYSYERRGWPISKGTTFTQKHKSIAIVHGFVFSQIMKVPFIGICVAPIVGIVAATLSFLELEKIPTS